MNKRVHDFLESVREGKRPKSREMSRLRRWLGSSDIAWMDWLEMQSAMMKAWQMDEEELREHLAVPRFQDVHAYQDDFLPLLDKYEIGGWLRDYVDYTKLSEPPTAFHFFCAMTILAASLRRRVWFDMGYFNIYPPIQIFLMGPSGVRKSTAADIAVDLARDATEGGEGIVKPLFNDLPDEGSGEGLKKHLTHLTKEDGEATGLLYVSEMTTFLGKQEYNRTLTTTLTDLFDGKDKKFRRTQRDGAMHMKDIGISVIMCSNEDLAFDSLSEVAFKGGLFGRGLIIYQKGSDRVVPLPAKMMDKMMNPQAKSRLQEGLLRTRAVRGAATMSAEAEGIFEDIYMKVANSAPSDENASALHKRKGGHILRFALLLSVSENMGEATPHITAKHIIQAEKLLEWIESQLPELYAFASRTIFGAELTRIYNMVKAEGGQMDESDIKARMATRIPGYVVDRHLATLRDSGIIQEVTLDPWKGRRGWEIIAKLGD